tara:strand:- start:1765 stop:2001 length:237 start_codon:yes stop_codon:yes gene_type:complete
MWSTMRQNKYLDEYEKYKNVQLEVGKIYTHRNDPARKFVLESYDFENNSAVLVSVDDDHQKTKTGHWARKHLRLVAND